MIIARCELYPPQDILYMHRLIIRMKEKSTTYFQITGKVQRKMREEVLRLRLPHGGYVYICRTAR